MDEAGDEFARGVVSCDHHEASLSSGHHTEQIAASRAATTSRSWFTGIILSCSRRCTCPAGPLTRSRNGHPTVSVALKERAPREQVEFDLTVLARLQEYLAGRLARGER